jgi:Flp pilus assembly protein TadG
MSKEITPSDCAHKGVTRGIWLGRRFAVSRRGSTAVEFAISGIAIFAFILGILNLGLLGLTLGTLQRATEQAARKAAVTAANYPNTACPTTANIQTYFNQFASPIIAANAATLTYSKYSSGSVVSNTANDPWVDNSSSTAPPGTYIALTATYRWKPVGFAMFSGVTLNIKTVAFAMGSPQC